MAKYSIQQRLSLGLIVLLIVAGIVLAQTSLWLLDQGLRRYVQAHLHNEAETLVSALQKNQQSAIELDQQRVSAAYQRPFSGEYFWIRLPHQDWRSRSWWDFSLDGTTTGSGLRRHLVDGPQAQKLLVYSTHFRRFGQDIEILTAQDYTPVLQGFTRVRWVGAIIGSIVLILLVLLQRIWVARALRPLEMARQQIAQLQQGERRLLDSNVPDELRPLVHQMNHLLQHTDNTLQRSRSAIGNLGHALKTPLAVLFSIYHRPELETHRELREQLGREIRYMQERIGHELARARFSGGALPGAHFNYETDIDALCETLRHIHSRDLNIQWSVDKQLMLRWDREDMLELLGNVLDNACKWAQHNVQLTITQSDGFIHIIVDDDGPGIAPKLREHVLERGVRLDERVPGHGIGLSIVNDIATFSGGELVLGDSPMHGLRVIVRLPEHPHHHS